MHFDTLFDKLPDAGDPQIHSHASSQDTKDDTRRRGRGDGKRQLAQELQVTESSKLNLTATCVVGAQV